MQRLTVAFFLSTLAFATTAQQTPNTEAVGAEKEADCRGGYPFAILSGLVPIPSTVTPALSQSDATRTWSA